jgi:WD40 repeat protein
MAIADEEMSDLTSTLRARWEPLLRRFDRAWQLGPPPAIEDYLPADESARPAVLIELVYTDLEYRLKSGEPARVEHYLARFPDLGGRAEAELGLIRAEWEFRRRREASLAAEEYLARFPRHRTALLTVRGTPGGHPTVADRGRCPLCGEPLESPADGPGGVVACAACGVELRLDPGPSPPARTRLGRYELIEEVGRGAFGVIYRARDTELDRIVAVKVPGAGRLSSPEAADRFFREARSAAQLKHPRIVPVFDAGRDGDTCYLVAEFIPGGTLADRLAAGRLSFREAAGLVARLAEALDYSHRRGVIHRDVKPSNILIDAAGQPHLTDFGLARREVGEITLTRDGACLGTPAYMSPEQARGESGRVDARSDLYSLGVVLYEILAGELPFRGSPAMVQRQVLEEEPRPPRRLNDRVPRDLETICLTCLNKEPERRYASAGALAEDLGRFLAGEPIVARPVGRAERLGRWCRRNPKLAGALASTAAALVAVAVLALLYARHQRTAAEEIATLLADSHRRLAILNYERGQAAFEKEEIGPGLLWMVECWRSSASAGDPAWRRSARAQLSAWRRHCPRLKAVFSHSGAVGVVAFSPDGQCVLTASLDGTARLWDAATGRPLGSSLRHQSMILAAALSPDGKVVLTGGEDNAARLWDVATGRPLGEPFHHQGAVRAVAFSPDGQCILTGDGDEGTARLWDAISGRPLGAPLRHQGRVVVVAFSPDGRVVLTGGGDATARLWEAATARPLGEPLRHEWMVSAAAFSPDGSIALTGNSDTTARLWDVATGRPLGPPLRHQSQVWAAAFSPDGRVALTAGLDGTARRWDVDELPDDLPRLSTWAEVLSGLAIDERGRIRVLSTDEWLERREILDNLGGPPGAGTCGSHDPVLFDDSALPDDPFAP